jgi:hypothetical protein
MRPYAILVLLTLGAISPLEAQKIDVYSWPERAERSRDYDVLHYRIELRFDEDARSYWGDTTITLTALENGFSTCVLDAETFVVDEVVDESSRNLISTVFPPATISDSTSRKKPNVVLASSKPPLGRKGRGTGFPPTTTPTTGQPRRCLPPYGRTTRSCPTESS